jgi:streptogramin lyase
MLALALAVAAAACTSATASKEDLRARVSPAPASLTSNTWSPTITVTRDRKPVAARIRLAIRKGADRRVFVPRATRRGVYRVRVVFPSDGRWTWTITTAGRMLARGSVAVSSRIRFELPFDLAVAPDGTIYFLDRGRILRIDAGTQRVRVHVGTESQELIAMVRLANGTFFVTDFPANRILRVDPTGSTSRVASVQAPADLVADETGTTLWVASIAEGVGVVRVDVATGRVEPFAHVENPHGIDRDPAGNFYVQDGRRISRVDGRTGAISRFADADGVKLLVAPDGSVYGVGGNPSGGRVVRVAQDGTVTTVVGTGTLGPHRDGRALEAQILPSAVQLAPDGTLLVTQVEPVPAVRRVDLSTGTISTLALGR